MALTVAIACAALTAAAVFAMLRTGWAHTIALDRPNARSLHSRAVPRSGGLVVVVVAMAPALLLRGETAALAAAALLLMVVSAIDDRSGLPVAFRLLAHLLVSAATVLLVHGSSPPWFVVVLALLLVWCINAFNFMDGSDGMAGGMAVLGFGCYAGQASLAGDPHVALVCAAVAGAALGFLFFNFAPARLFMGDAGSVPLGFLAAALGLFGWEAKLWSGWFPFLVFSAFLLDASITLVRRLARREKVWQAHKEHLYQRMVAGGLGHTRTALAAYGVMTASAVLALVVERVPPAVGAGLAVAWLVGSTVLHFIGVRRFGTT